MLESIDWIKVLKFILLVLSFLFLVKISFKKKENDKKLRLIQGGKNENTARD